MLTRRIILTFVMLCIPVTCQSICPKILAEENPQIVGGKQDILRLIDYKNILSIGIRNPAEVIKKSQEIRDRANLKNAFNVGDFVDAICQTVKLEGCIDRTSPFIVCLGTPKLFAGKIHFSVTDVNKLASNLNVSAERLQEGEVCELPPTYQCLVFSLCVCPAEREPACHEHIPRVARHPKTRRLTIGKPIRQRQGNTVKRRHAHRTGPISF